ncbi:MAG: hypothetical protein M3304_10725 [Actinomycetota bacterium]|nr:hypothetical protein [Actinomycetota bacterium]
MKRVASAIVPLFFALRRVKTRLISVSAVALALAAAADLVGWSSVAGALSQEENVRVRLSQARSDERSVAVVYHVPVGERDLRRGDVDAVFEDLADVTEPARRVSMLHSVGPAGIRLVAVGDPERDVELTRGRLPATCRAGLCDGLAIAGPFRIGQRIALGRDLSVRLVGRGSVRREVLPVDSKTLTQMPDLTDQAVLVPDFGPPLAAFADETGTTIATTAALDPNAVQGSALRSLSERLRIAFVELERTGPLLDAQAPFEFLDELADRGEVARERLLLVAGQGAALVVAVAVFAAAARRRDTELLADQLTTLGASRGQTAVARLAEAAVPTLVGAALGVGALVVTAVLVAKRRGLPAQVVRDAVSVETVATIASVTLAAIALLYASTTTRPRSRFRIGALELAAVVALGLVVWQASTSGALDPEGIEAGQRGGPVLLLLPALAFFATGVFLLHALPLVLALAERLARRGSFAVRLAFLTAARRPTDAAAATTFLALTLGVALFGLNYRATLARQAHDEADFAAGAAWRVVERAPPRKQTNLRPAVELAPADLPPPNVADEPPLNREFDVTPLTRFTAATDERPVAVLRLQGRVEEASVAGRGLEIEVLGVPAGRLPQLLGWRRSFSGLDRSQIASRLRPEPIRLDGPRVASDVDALRFWAWSGTDLERFVVFHFLRPGEQRFVHLRGSVLTRGRWQRVSLRVPFELRGAMLVALEFPAVSVPQSAPPDEGFVQIGRFEQRRRGRWSPLPNPLGWAATPGGGSVELYELGSGPVRRMTQFNLEGSPLALIHPDIGLPTALPAAVSASVAAAAVDGRVTIAVGGTAMPIRVAAETRFFPTIVNRPSDFVVLDYETLFAALNAARPAVALPSEAWFFRNQGEPFRERLSHPPFRTERVVGAVPLTARLLSDPLAGGARNVLTVTAVAAAVLGLVGLFLASRATLAAERLLLAEYEALGIGPETLVRSTQLRLMALSALGIVAGFLGSLLAVRLIASLVAVTGTGGRPLPPIEPVVAWRADAVVVGIVATGALVGSAFLARRAFRETVGRRLRA